MLFTVSNREIEIGKKLLDAYKSRKDIFKEFHSEAKNDRGIKRDLYLNYITLTSSIDYQKGIKADILWKSTKRWVQDYPWLFKPKELLSKPIPEMMGVFEEIKEKNGGVFRIQDIGIWLSISTTLLEFGGGTSTLLEKFDNDAFRIYEELSGNLKKKFPFLSGSKILPMWLKVLFEDADIPLKNIKKIPLPVDKNVARITHNLILMEKFKDGNVNVKVRENVRNIWEQIAKEMNIPVIVFDTPLWFLGGNGCANKNCKKCPSELRSMCHIGRSR